MTSYTGGRAQQAKVNKLISKREKAKEEIERKMASLKEPNAGAGKISFSTTRDVPIEVENHGVGLVTLDELKEREIQMKLEKERLEGLEGKKKKKKREISTLSFDAEEEDEEEEELSWKKKKIGKNPEVNTSFLPDREREAEELKEIEDLKAEWMEKQAVLKAEEIEMTFNYWDGSGHRHKVSVIKGNTIEQFLTKCLEELEVHYPEARSCTVDMLMFVKADLIIPHHISFYQFEQMKARGEKGPLFRFVNYREEEGRPTTLLKDDLKYGKVTLRSWYERNKHCFPANQWKAFDPEKNWDKYTLEQTFNRRT